MLGKRSEPGFRASVALCNAFLAEIKMAPVLVEKNAYRGFISDRLEDLTYFARQTESDTETPQTEILDETERVLQEFCTTTLTDCIAIFRPKIYSVWITSLGTRGSNALNPFSSSLFRWASAAMLHRSQATTQLFCEGTSRHYYTSRCIHPITIDTTHWIQ